MNAETIKDFLVSLGFQVDDAGARKFEATLTGVTVQVAKMSVAVEASALAVVAFTAKIASGLDNLYWAGQRTGATVQGIQQIGFAVSQMGGSVDAARGSLESLSRFVRNNPGAEGFLNRLGVQTRDAGGNMRDMASIFTGVGQRLSSMPYYRANQYAQMLGIDENTLMAMRRGVGQFSAQYSQMAKTIGYNADVAAVSSNKFMTSLRSFGQMAGMARDKIGSNLAEGLSGSLDNLRKLVLDNFPKIEGVITSGIKGLLWLADVIGQVIFRLIQAAGDIQHWWQGLDKGTKQLIETFGALVIAWRVLNSAFLTSPIGIVTALIGALALLYDDYKGWKEGSKSLIDWEKWEPGITAAKGALDWFTDKLNGLNSGTIEWNDTLKALSDFMKGDWSKAINDAINQVNLRFNGFFEEFGRKLANSPFWRLLRRAHIMSEKDTEDLQQFFSGTMQEPEQHAQSVNAGASRGTLADRNNNPGNIRPVGGSGFRMFQSAYHGWEAMKNQLMRYFTGKTTGRQLRTLTDIISTWAPSSENNTGKYIADVSKWMGVSPDAALNLTNPQVMTSLMQSMARKEGYSDWRSPQAAAAAGARVNQETVINIHGVSDPMQAGREIAERQINVNSRLAQSLEAGPR